ncbi:DUF3489 domain-containing protein [Aurantiacibacter arachoides]|nr:DUF3489 domain-containing protein [Aurantiacibacter arachoides]GGD63559.1 hypothetical protein GCM10011411_24880 [Aurantiacibacter arachoides]
MNDIIDTTKPAKRTRRIARQPESAAEGQANTAPTAAKAARPDSKSSLVLRMLQRPEGATIGQIVTATGWLPHTTRAALTGLKKKGHEIANAKGEGEERVYRAVAG